MRLPDRPRSVVLLSGGLDSTALAALYVSDGWDVAGLFIDHGQPARVEERQAAEAVVGALGLQLDHLSLDGITQVPSGQALPGRNALFLLSALARYGQSVDVVGIGIHHDSGYWDCSPEFISAMQLIFDGYSLGIVRIGSPFLKWSKREIAVFAAELGAPVGQTYSCDLPHGPCGTCGSCRDAALALA